METSVGVDGCKAGWFAVTVTDDGEWSHALYESAEALLDRYADAGRILIDIPIGLVEGRPKERKCDLEARRLLGKPRNASVFPVPSRAALSSPTYEDAGVVNTTETGHGLSLQTWGILPKIREVDQLMQQSQSARATLVEVHPELLFWALNGRRPREHHKGRGKGRSERLGVLQRWFPTAEDVYASAAYMYMRKHVAFDDIIDATVAAVAGVVGTAQLIDVPEPPETDSTGLPMRMAIPSVV
ncbi:MAG: DUF429 domain-containing protein [Chloroflexi bacterium]|nr:DUF429 domain-containing protein [Chloroflexota bacterium]